MPYLYKVQYKSPDKGSEVVYSCWVNGGSSAQCTYQIRSSRGGASRRCKLKTGLVLGLCHHHLRMKHNLRVKTSSFANAGRGLFAQGNRAWRKKQQKYIKSGKRGEVPVFRRGQSIVSYAGELLTLDQLSDRYNFQDDQGQRRTPTPAYGVQVSDWTVLDAACQRSAGAYANSILPARMRKPQDPKNTNAIIFIYGGKVSLRASKNIRNGEEIIVYYGNEYWKDVSSDVQHTTKYVPPRGRSRHHTGRLMPIVSPASS